MAALVACNFVFFFQHKQLLARKPPRDLERDSKSDRPSTNNDYVITRISHSETCHPSRACRTAPIWNFF
jgi:hypothetical protein